MVLYTNEEVRAALEPLRAIPAYTEILTIDPPEPPKRKPDKPGEEPLPKPVSVVKPESEEGNDGKPVSTDTSGAKPKIPVKKSACPSKQAKQTVRLLGKPPRKCPMPTAASMLPPLPEVMAMFMGCNTADEFSSLLEYLQLNGGWFPFQVQWHGACQFAAFRRGIDCPMEFTNTHLHRQLVMDVVRHKEFFLPQLKDFISGNYGAKLLKVEYERHDKEGLLTVETRHTFTEPGPFSFVTYLEYLLKHDSWGDEITVVVLSMLFQLRITIVTIPTLHSEAIRHTNVLEKSDIVLLRSGGNHYLSAGKLYLCFACLCLWSVRFEPVFMSPKVVILCCVLLMSVLSCSEADRKEGQSRHSSPSESTSSCEISSKVSNV